MKVNARGQVTIPHEMREQLGLLPGTEVEVEFDGGVVYIRRLVRHEAGRGGEVVERLRGRGRGGMSTDELMALLRGPDDDVDGAG